MTTLAARMALIRDTLAERYPGRIVTRSLKDFAARQPAELKRGIYTVVSKGEGDFANLRERAAMDGKHRLLLVGQIQLQEKADGEAIEDAEFAMIEEIKEFLRDLPPALACLDMTGYQQSAQVEAPYGWIAADLEIDS